MTWREVHPEALLRFLHEAKSATWIASRDGLTGDVSEWTALTGQTEAEALGWGWIDAVHPDDVERVRAAWETAVAHGSSYNSSYRLRRADGQYRWFNARGIPTYNAEGDPEHWVGMMFAIPNPTRIGSASGAEVDADAVLTADRFDDISPAALRAARAMLGWSAEELAQRAGLARSTLRRLEDDHYRAPRRGSVEKVLEILAREALRFVGSEGVIRGVVDSGQRRSNAS